MFTLLISHHTHTFSCHTHTHAHFSYLLVLHTHTHTFTGPRQNYKEAREFIARMFININPQRSADIYPHFTCATDTENIKFVFDVVKNHILQQHIIEVIPGL